MSRQRKQGKERTRRPAKGRPARGHVGRAGMHRSRRQRLTIGTVAVGALAVIWVWTAVTREWGLGILLSALLLLALPAFVVLTMGKRY